MGGRTLSVLLCSPDFVNWKSSAQVDRTASKHIHGSPGCEDRFGMR